MSEAITDDHLHRRYAAWAHRVPSLYSFLSCHVLETPSLTVQWIADSKRDLPNRGYSVQHVALGTYSIDRPNYLSLYHTFLPREWEEVIYDDATNDDDNAFRAYPETLAEAGKSIVPYKRVVHDGEVNIARAMPQRPSVVATRGPHNLVHVFDFSRRRSEPEDHFTVRPDAQLRGARKEGFALGWSPATEGWIASGGGDMIVQVWDLEATVGTLGTAETQEHNSVVHFSGHTDCVESVSWHSTHGNMLASAGSDKHVFFWDTRVKKFQQKEEVHTQPVYSVNFHPTGVFLFATTSQDCTARIWDMRKMRKPVFELIGHTGDVYGTAWSPFCDTVVASYSKDGTVAVWDVSKMSIEPDPVEDLHASPMLVFRHFGHLDAVRDVSWNPNEGNEWIMASVDDANQLHLWQPHSNVTSEEEAYNVFAADLQ